MYQVQLIPIFHKRPQQDKLLQTRVSIFQTACLDPLRHQVMAVPCIALPRHIFLLSLLLSSLAKQTALTEEPFTSPIQTMGKVFCMEFVVMIVIQRIVLA
jgi:hypothetical protein